jgi:hypothetical protein
MEPGCGSLTLVGDVRAVRSAAFGVFHRLKVMDLDFFFLFLFLCLVLHGFSFPGLLFLLCQWRRTAIDARL